MGFKVSVGNFIEVPIHLKLRDGGQLREFKFHITGKRLNVAQVQQAMPENGDTTVGEFLAENLTGWRGQTLVLDEQTGQGADFSPPALEALLDIGGVASIVYMAYLKELAATDGAEGRRKN